MFFSCLQGYYACASGKAKQAAKTEMEKLKNLSDMTCAELIKEAAKMYEPSTGTYLYWFMYNIIDSFLMFALQNLCRP